MTTRRLLRLTFFIGIMLSVAVGTLWIRSALQGNERLRLTRSRTMKNAFLSEALILTCERDRMKLRWVRDHDDLDDDPARVAMTTSGWNFDHGGFELARSVFVGPGGPEPGRNDFFELEPNRTIALVSPPRDWMHFGYAIEEPWARTWTTDRSIFVPPWFAFLLCAGPTIVLGGHLWREHRRRSRTKHGLCETCAYDLRGAAHERCPECGEIVVVVASTHV